MSSQIPPLVCHTPPPMDFDDEEEDEVDLPDPEDDFDDFGSAPAAAENEDLPTPVPPPLPDFDSPIRKVRKSPSVEGSPRKEKDVSPPIPPQAVIEDVPDDTELEQPRNESPPSLILSQNNFSENDVPSDDEFQDFAFHPPQEETGTPPGAEDNISLPSLHLDTEVSKSATPVQLSENETSERDSSPQEPEVEEPEPEPEPVPEAAITPIVAEDNCCRFDDNTENDFTDFTTASNERSVVLEVPTANDVSFDDDFAHLESTPSADSNFVSQSKTDFATFDADFSKFDSFQASFPATFDDPGSIPKDASAKQVTNSEEKSTPEAPNEDDFGNDDFDDFQEFAKFPSETEKSSKPVEEEAAKVISEPSFDDDEDDDDFGEFSDFKQSEVAPVAAAPIVPTSRSALFKAESILTIISEMFPSYGDENKDDTGQVPWVDLLLRNKVYNELNDMDSAQALSYQYNNSESNKSLIRALGIDSRNILFGPKWNSSMPRFAANLSFSPLEPIKPVAASSSNINNNNNSSSSSAAIANTSSSSISSSSSSAAKQEPPSKHHPAHSHVAFGLDPLQPSSAAPLAPGAVAGNVPAVQFDWTSSGLVNPLEGVQEILQEGGALQSNKNGPKGEVLDTKIAENSGTAAADEVVASKTQSILEPSPFAPEETIAKSTTTKAHHSSFDDAPSGNEDEDGFEFVGSSNSSNSNQHQQPTSIPTTTCPPVSHAVMPPPAAVSLALGLSSSSSSSSSSPSACSSPLATTSTAVSSGGVVRTIKLPETHIYTPSKGVNPVSRDSTNRTEMYAEVGGDLRPSGGFDKSIVVREYRDVEYSLEKTLSKNQALAGGDEEFDDFREFQAVESAGKKEDKEWSGSKRTHLDVGGDFNFGNMKDKVGSYLKPVFGTSPTEELDQMDDDFSEFQAAVPVPEPAKPIVNKPLATVSNEQNRSNTSSPILLSPSILLPQQAQPLQATETGRLTQINWPEPGIDPDELARFEAAFPKPKAAPQSISSNNTTPKHVPAPASATAADDDEWTDFVYSKPATEKPPPTNSKSSNPTHANNQQEEWTDFIYSTPASQNLSSSQNNFNYQNNSFGASRLNGPKFNSWNQPQLPPPQFSSWNSNNYYYTPPTNTNSRFSTPSAAQNQKVPTFPSAHAPAHHHPNLNNFYQTPQSTVPSSQTRNIGQPNYIPGISQLPELSFITPNSTAGSSTPGAGVKPFAHSFLNNVISSNNFTKK
ncbi:mucin-2 [Ochlerotatus camptorhynchus]|uniref:mucin-2 n=1 Tax=Ochlerotatus camptorhynchus TaxID=644619 RepID=UPI0031D39E69